MNPLEFMNRFFTIRKGVFAKFAQKNTTKKTFRNMHDFKSELIELKKYAQEHNLEAEIKEIDKLILEANSSIESSGKLFRDATVIVDDMVKLDNKIKSHGFKKIINAKMNDLVKKDILSKIKKQHDSFAELINHDIIKERKRLLPIISTTQAGIDKTVNMESYWDALKKDEATYLDYYKIRSQFKTEVNYMHKAKVAYQNMIAFIDKISRASNNVKLQGQYIKRLEEEMKHMYDYLAEAFKASFKVIMREIYLLYIIQDNLEDFFKEDDELRAHREIPQETAKRTKENIDNLEKQLNGISRTEVFVIQNEAKAERRAA